LSDHPPIKFMVSISGSKFRDPSICNIAYKDPIKVKSVHFIGEKDWLKIPSEELASAFVDPIIIRHPQGHTAPRLDDASVKQLSEWSSNILEDLKNEDGQMVMLPRPWIQMRVLMLNLQKTTWWNKLLLEHTCYMIWLCLKPVLTFL